MINFEHEPALESDFSQYATLEYFKEKLEELKQISFENTTQSEIQKILLQMNENIYILHQKIFTKKPKQ